MNESNLKTRVNEILAKYGLDFVIEKAPMVCINTKGEQVPSPYFGLINLKSMEVINTCKEGYTVSQNAEIVELVLRGMESFGSTLSVTKAGTLNGGRKVFIQLKVEETSRVGMDTITRFITIIDSNDGSTGLSVGIGDVTMSCSNQFVRFYKKGDAKFRHTATIEQKLKTIPFLIEKALVESFNQMEEYRTFTTVAITDANVHSMVKAVLGYDKVYTSMDVLAEKSTKSINIMNELYDHITKETNEKGRNVWGLHSGITSYTTHAKSHPKRENGEIESLMTGGAYDYNQKSLAFAKKLCGITE